MCHIRYLALSILVGLLVSSHALAFTVLGTGSGSLVGGDLTDPENDGAGDANTNYNATFFSDREPGFGGGEFAFNVFDNTVGGGNAKWCCGDTAGPTIVGAMNFTAITEPIQLTSFTLTSGNDSTGRDPVDWEIQGSNDTTTGLDGTWTTIFDHPDSGTSDWNGTRNEVILYSPDEGDTFLSTEGFTAFRLVTDATQGGGQSGAWFQLNEIEFFGVAAPPPVPEPSSIALWSLLGLTAVGFGWWRRNKNRK